MLHRLIFLMALMGALPCMAFTFSKKTAPTDKPDYDYLVLALSWSPEYCANEGEKKTDTEQCSRSYGFVLHGLWPQYEVGYPKNCPPSSHAKPLLIDAIKDYPHLFPAVGLWLHEWHKHGTCITDNPRQYLDTVKTLMQKVHPQIPVAYQKPPSAFRDTVDSLGRAWQGGKESLSAPAIVCSGNGRFLREVRLCFDKALNPRACSDSLLKTNKRCRNGEFTVRPAR